MNDRVIRTAFVISFIGHCLFLGMPGFSLGFIQNYEKPEEITVKIEIEEPSLLPKIDVLGEEKKLKEVAEKLKSPEPEPETQQEIVMERLLKEQNKEKIEVIDSAQEAMLRYQDMVKQRIEEVRRYPAWAKSQGIEGAVHLNFKVLTNGLSKDTKIISSSGSKSLDDEAVVTIQRANPFPPIPPKINQDSIAMEVTIVFALN